jgi:hypothetical protein
MSASLLKERAGLGCVCFQGTVFSTGGQAPKRVWTNIRVAPDADPSRRSRAGRPFVVVVAAAAAQAHAAATRGRAGRRAMIGQHGRARRPICPSPSIVGRFPVTIPEMLSRADLVPRSVRWMDGWIASRPRRALVPIGETETLPRHRILHGLTSPVR